MACCFVFVVIPLALLVDILAVRALWKDGARLSWWLALILMAWTGVLGGICCASCYYRPTDRLGVYGFPIPYAILRFEDGEFVEDGISPMMDLIMALNFVGILLLSLWPVSVVYFIRRRKPGDLSR